MDRPDDLIKQFNYNIPFKPNGTTNTTILRKNHPKLKALNFAFLLKMKTGANNPRFHVDYLKRFVDIRIFYNGKKEKVNMEEKTTLFVFKEKLKTDIYLTATWGTASDLAICDPPYIMAADIMVKTFNASELTKNGVPILHPGENKATLEKK